MSSSSRLAGTRVSHWQGNGCHASKYACGRPWCSLSECQHGTLPSSRAARRRSASAAVRPCAIWLGLLAQAAPPPLRARLASLGMAFTHLPPHASARHRQYPAASPLAAQLHLSSHRTVYARRGAPSRYHRASAGTFAASAIAHHTVARCRPRRLFSADNMCARKTRAHENDVLEAHRPGVSLSVPLSVEPPNTNNCGDARRASNGVTRAWALPAGAGPSPMLFFLSPFIPLPHCPARAGTL